MSLAADDPLAPFEAAVNYHDWTPSNDGAQVISADMFAAARTSIADWPNYAPTPLYQLPALARRTGIAEVMFKDEGPRFGLKSFKALGGAYAVQALLAEHRGEAETGAENITVTCATDGNHGRSVAWGAQTFGCACVIFIHAEVSEGRARAIEAYGARVVRVDGNYDDSVHAAASAAEENGWYVISDTSYEGYMEVPKRVMAGYGVIAAEIIAEIGDAPPPTHTFLQGGVGGFAGAMAEAFHQHWGDGAPRMIMVEPELAACLYRSAEAGRMTEIPVDEETLMAGLSCGVPSVVAWDILAARAGGFMTIPESMVAPAMQLMANPLDGDPSIEAGESAIAGLAGFVAGTRKTEIKQAIDLGAESRVLLIGTEGATDPDVYAALLAQSG